MKRRKAGSVERSQDSQKKTKKNLISKYFRKRETNDTAGSSTDSPSNVLPKPPIAAASSSRALDTPVICQIPPAVLPVYQPSRPGDPCQSPASGLGAVTTELCQSPVSGLGTVTTHVPPPMQPSQLANESVGWRTGGREGVGIGSAGSGGRSGGQSGENSRAATFSNGVRSLVLARRAEAEAAHGDSASILVAAASLPKGSKLTPLESQVR